MDKLKLEDFICGAAHCHKIPKPGDKIYSCSACSDGHQYRCENCSINVCHYHTHGGRESALKFDPKLTKLVLEHFTPPCNESQKREYFCSNSMNGCQEEFLAQKAHEKSCIYQKIPCPSLNCKEVIAFKDVDDHMEQSHKMLKINKEMNFKGTLKDWPESHLLICCLSSYDQKFFPQIFVKDKNLHFKVIMLDHQVNTIPFDVNMTFFLEDGKNISMKNRVYPVTENGKKAEFSKVSLEHITQYFDSKSMELKCQPKINFCLKIINEKMDEIAKDKNENVESGNLFI